MNLHLDANAILRFLLKDVEDQAHQVKSVIDTGKACLSNEEIGYRRCDFGSASWL